MADLPAPDSRASDADRADTRRVLQDACVDGRINLEELSDRIAQVEVARTHGELQVLVQDLPPAPAVVPVLPTVPAVTAIMGSAERTGPWRLDEHCRVRAIMGSAKLDLRGAAMAAPVCTIDAYILMGSLEIVVPEGVVVDLAPAVIMGSKSLQVSGEPLGEAAPVIHVVGSVIAGSVKVRSQPTLGERLRGRLDRMLED
ncbi:MAG: DUF1707 SHOCT-like domain-containing protein [Chloroflexota bacterium]